MSEQKYVCIDLDGTIAHYEDWKGEEFFGDPVDGVQNALKKLRKEGWTIIIYTTRSNKALIRGYLDKHGIPFDYINDSPGQPENAMGGKPYAHAYIDDRGIQFNGDWSVTLNEVLHFAPWETRTELNQGDAYQKEAIGFLRRDFSEAFSQLREYDRQLWEITRFSFVQLVGSIGAVWVVFSLATAKNPPSILTSAWELVGSILLIISSLFGILAIQYIMRLRVYFAVTARYVNDHRNFFLSTIPIGFRNRTGYYVNYHYPKAFDRDSTHLLSIYFICVVGSFILGFGVGLLTHYLGLAAVYAALLGTLTWIAVATGEIAYAVHHLNSKTDTGTDPDVFGIE